MIRLLWLAIFILLSMAGYAQNRTIDSLFNVLETANDDTSKVRLFSQISKEYLSIDKEKARELANKGLKLAKKLDDMRSMAEAYFVLGETHNTREHKGHDFQLEYYYKALKTANRFGFRDIKAEALALIGTTYERLVDYPRNFHLMTLGMIAMEAMEDTIGMGFIQIHFGKTYLYFKNYEKAETYFLKALEYYENKAFQNERNIVYNYLGNISIERNELEKAKNYYIKCIEASEKNRPYFFQDVTGTCYCNLGVVYKKQNKYMQALEYMHEGLRWVELGGQRENLGYVYREIAQCLIEKEKTGDTVYVSLPMLARFNYNYISLAEESLKIALTIGKDENILKAYQTLVKVYEAGGNLQKAYLYQQNYIDYRDNMLEQDLKKIHERMLIDHELNDRDSRYIIHLLARTRSLIIVLLFSLIIILLIIFFYSRIRKNKRKLEKLNHTKDLLYAIISHDLRGPITSFQHITKIMAYYIAQNNLDRIEEINQRINESVSNLNTLLDNLLNWVLSQEKEDSLLTYEKINLYKLIFESSQVFRYLFEMKKLNFKNGIPDDLFVSGDYNSLAVIFRNLISNACKFTETGGNITATAAVSKDYIVIKISDTGIGMPPEKQKRLFEIYRKKSSRGTEGEKGSGLGLLLCKELVSMHKGDIAAKSEMGKGATFIIKLPHIEKNHP